MASTKRQNPSTEEQSQPEPEFKKSKVHITEPDSSSSEPQQAIRVVLNPADCSLDFNIEGEGLSGHSLYEGGFAYCWSGARGDIGITGGKYCFGCKVVSAQPVEMEDTPVDQKNVCRIGISRGDDSVGNLGETAHSYGYGGTGKFSNLSKFRDYGERFGVGDTIVCLVDLESEPMGSIEFSRNGKRLGIAKHFGAGSRGLGVIDSAASKLPWEAALFPHVLLKNMVVEMQFSIEDGLAPEEGYKPWASAVIDGKAVRGPSFSDPRDCEAIMLVGLPASGKTTWAEKRIKEHPEKRYVLLGTNLALDQMKVQGLLRTKNYAERFDRLMDRATVIFNTLLSRASKIPRSYIIDQTNVYKSARKRKLKPFAMYRKIAVVLFPKPDELKRRSDKRFKEMGKEVPTSAVTEMIANFVLPVSKDMRGADEYFDEVIFTELDRAEAQRHLDDMKRDAALSSNGHKKNDHEPLVQGSSIGLVPSMSVYSSPVLGHNYSGYSSPLPECQVRQGVRGLPVPNAPPYADVHATYMGPGPLGRVDRVHPFPTSVDTGHLECQQTRRVEPYAEFYASTPALPSRDNYLRTYSSDSSSNLRESLGWHNGYGHDPYQRYNATMATAAEFVNGPGDARTGHQPAYGSPVGYGHDPYQSYGATYSIGTAAEFINSPGDARTCHQSAYSSPVGPPPPTVHIQPPGGSPYGLPPPRYY